MYFTCLFRNRPKSMRAERYAENKLKELVCQFTHKPFRIHLSIELNGIEQVANLRLITDKVFSTSLSATGSGTYEAIDNLADKLREFLRRKKERMATPPNGLDKFSLARLDNEVAMRQWLYPEQEEVDAQEILAYEAKRRTYGKTIQAGR